MKNAPTALSFRGRRPDDDEFIEAVGREAFARWSLKPGVVVRELIAHPGASTRIASDGSKRVGFVVVRFEEPSGAIRGLERPLVARIDAIAVLRGARGRGIGAALLAHAESIAEERGAQVLALSTAERNRRALRLFARGGYLPLLAWAEGYSRGGAALELFKPLRPAD